MAQTDGIDGVGEQLYVRGSHCSIGSDAACTSSSDYKVSTSAEWKMANICLFCHDITEKNNAVIWNRTEKMEHR